MFDSEVDSFMKEFFGIGGFTREPEGYLSWQHLTFVSFLMIAMVALAVFLGLRNKNRNDKKKNAVLIWAALLIDGFEIFKIILNCSQDPEAWKTNLPLFLCSIQLITIPLAAFTRGRIKEASLDFVCIFGILGALLGYLLGEIGPLGLTMSLGFASGAMLYVVFGEILPQAIIMYRSKLPAFSAIAGILVGLLIIFA